MDRTVMDLKTLALLLTISTVSACSCDETASSSYPETWSLQANSKASSCFSAIFAFGSSVADTGTGVLARVDSPANNFPYGIDFPGGRSGRWSNGRLLIDFWAEALCLPYLDPFLKSMSSSFRQGANFACGGSTATKSKGSGPVTFSLDVQLYQFRRFKTGVLAAHLTGQEDCSSSLPPESVFRDALYIIASGANDLLSPINSRAPIETIKAALPEVSSAIMNVVRGLYDEGARNILVEDVYPIGCMALYIALNVSIYGDAALPDSFGCVSLLNELAVTHNSLLKEKIVAFCQIHPDLSITMVDTYSIRLGLMTNPAKYGFKYGVEACCGVVGLPLRTSNTNRCGESQMAQPCTDRSEFVVWDGLHYTEAANFATMKAILSGEHFYPRFPIIKTLSSRLHRQVNWQLTASCHNILATQPRDSIAPYAACGSSD